MKMTSYALRYVILNNQIGSKRTSHRVLFLFACHFDPSNEQKCYNKKAMKKIIIVVGVLILVGVGIFYIRRDVASQPDYKNISYQIESQSVMLKDGVDEVSIVSGSSTKSITRYFGNETKGDVNGDGIPDLVFLLTQENGGSATFYYVVAAFQNEKGGYTGTNAVLLGDRIAPQTTEFRDGEIIVNYADRKAGDPMTTKPSVGVSKYLKVVDNQLIEVSQ